MEQTLCLVPKDIKLKLKYNHRFLVAYFLQPFIYFLFFIKLTKIIIIAENEIMVVQKTWRLHWQKIYSKGFVSLSSLGDACWKNFFTCLAKIVIKLLSSLKVLFTVFNFVIENQFLSTFALDYTELVIKNML